MRVVLQRRRTSQLAAGLRRFFRGDGGSVTAEFVIMFPVFVFLFLSSVEFGIYSLRQSMLERALDITVRTVRINTGDDLSHDGLKDEICANVGMVPDCATTLRLEMISVDPRAWQGLPFGADCVDRAAAVSPVRNFSPGQANDLMLLRACVSFEPIFPSTGLGFYFKKNTAGDSYITARSAFVQEPD